MNRHRYARRRLEGRAFTLIEMLIVVSIISILAVIALPNFEDAQTRAKVSAAKNNMRALGMKMELFSMDTNRHMLAGKWQRMLLYWIPWWVDWPSPVRITPQERFVRAYKYLYGPLEDPFARHAFGFREDRRWLANDVSLGHLTHGFSFFQPQAMLDAIDYGCTWEGMDERVWKGLVSTAGAWVLFSPGPDLISETPDWLRMPCEIGTHTPGPPYSDRNLFIEYDPTNGTRSYGNIFRTHLNPAGLGELRDDLQTTTGVIAQ